MDTHLVNLRSCDGERGCEHSAFLPPPPAQPLIDIMRVEIFEPDTCVACINGTLVEDVSFRSDGPPAFSIAMILHGNGRTQIDGAETLELVSGMMTVFISNQHVSGVDHIDGGQHIEAVAIRLSANYIQRTVGDFTPVLFKSLLTDRSDPLSGTSLFGLALPPSLIGVAHDILACTIDNQSLRSLYIRAKVMEAFAITMTILAHDPPRSCQLCPRDRIKIVEARELMQSLLNEPWTIASLAAAVGISETKLKTGFRQLLGTSVRAHLRQLRISHAAHLIAAGEKVTEAALATGFQSLSHFSRAFREVKGVGPREFAKSRTGVW